MLLYNSAAVFFGVYGVYAMEFKAYYKTEDNSKLHEAQFKKIKYGNAVVVALDITTGMPLDSDCGAVIDIDFDERVVEYSANYLSGEYWCKIFFGRELKDLPYNTQLMTYKKPSGDFGIILPIVSDKYKCVLRGAENSVEAVLFSWAKGLTECHAPAFVYSEGKNPFGMIKECTYAAMEYMGTNYKTIEEKSYPEIFEYLGWCSWDAMQIRVDAEGITDKCREFREKDIPVKWVLFDDMWGEVHDFYGAQYSNFQEMMSMMKKSRLYSFHADPKRFPSGLGQFIKQVNQMGCRVGIWHPTTGYWFGIDPQGPVYKKLKESLYTTPRGSVIHGYTKQDAYAFYDSFHSYLKDCGADFVKIDNQSMINRFYRYTLPVGTVARNIHEAMEESVGKYFANNLINCMGMAAEDIWNRPQSAVSRCSGDFMPENNSWFVGHILQCAYNSFMLSPLYYCDYDMWWTDDEQALKNCVLHAVSGGPVYISDKIGRSRPDVLYPLCLDDGRILRCDRPGMPAADCLTNNPADQGRALVIQNVCRGTGVMALFNLSVDNYCVSSKISPCQIDGLSGEKFLFFEFFSKDYFILGYNEWKDVTVNSSNDIKLYNIVALNDDFTPIGISEKMLAARTFGISDDGEIEFYTSGTFIFYKNDTVCRYSVDKDEKYLVRDFMQTEI